MYKKFLPPLILLMLISGCDSNRIYEKNKDFKNHHWLITEVPTFTFPIKNTSTPYNVKFNIRYSNQYRYQNLYMTYVLEDSTGIQIDSTLTNQILFDPKSGRPRGSGLGDIFENQYALLSDYNFENPGEYTIKLRQTMRPDTLREIVSVGIRVEKSTDQ